MILAQYTAAALAAVCVVVGHWGDVRASAEDGGQGDATYQAARRFAFPAAVVAGCVSVALGVARCAT